jgi:Zn-dependent M28 family amino/carboxypeptidase
VVLVGGHLDSWDMGTGAIDDGAGVAIMTAAAKRVAAAGQPLRTIRVVWFGSEEINGGDDVAYKEWHGAEKHVLVGESDFGADRVWRFDTRVVDPSAPIVKEMAQRLEPLGIAWGNNDAHGGSDIEAMVLAGAPVIDLNQDGTRYFDIHHTPDDTLDKIDPVQLEQNVAAWAAVIDVAANSKDELKPGPPPKGE